MNEKESKLTYTEALKVILDKVEDLEDYVKSMDNKVDSIDDRERLLQKDLSDLHGFLRGRKEAKTEQQLSWKHWMGIIGLVLTAVALAVDWGIKLWQMVK